MSKNLSKRYSWIIALFIGALTLLTGCVNYDVGINIQGQHQGTIVQHIQLEEQFTNFSQEEAKQWLKSIENRAKDLHGKVKRLASNDIEVIIPFANGQELAQKFNQFFNPDQQTNSGNFNNQELEWLSLNSQLSVTQSNLVFVERNKINLTVDLTGLGVLSEQGNLIISSGSLLNLGIVLNTPWGAKFADNGSFLIPTLQENNQALSWQLQPGQINTIEAVFWIPSYLGIGTFVIIIFVYLGYLVRYKFGFGS
jgi:hypothetical protein